MVMHAGVRALKGSLGEPKKKKKDMHAPGGSIISISKLLIVNHTVINLCLGFRLQVNLFT